jgi:ribosomal-protein-alanine N-acetyltransferase
MQELAEKFVKGGNQVLVQIAPLTEDCVEDVKKLELECGLSPWSINDYKKEIERVDSVAMVAKKDGEVAGFLVARLITISESKIIPNERHEIELYNIAVKSGIRNQGIGQTLLNQLLAGATSLKVSGIWLEVRESNSIAIQFYKKNGFKLAYIRNNFYSSPPENAIVMKLDVSKSP